MGILVNLENDETPRDIYTEVITKVNQKLRATEDHRAKKWLMLQPDRSLAKPCVMTTPYSATNTAFYYFAYDWATKRAKTPTNPTVTFVKLVPIPTDFLASKY